MGGQGGCERRIKVFVKMQKKKFFWAGGSKGGGRGRVGGGDQGEDLSDYNRFPKFQPGGVRVSGGRVGGGAGWM